MKKLENILAENMRRFGTKNLNEGTLNYAQAIALEYSGNVVKNHIKSKYPELYYGRPNNILGKYGKDIPGTSWKKLEKLAKDKGDKDLEIAISKYKDLANKYKVDYLKPFSANKYKVKTFMSKKINWKSLKFEDIDPQDYPDFANAYVSYAEYEDGSALTDDELEKLDTEYPKEVYNALENYLH